MSFTLGKTKLDEIIDRHGIKVDLTERLDIEGLRGSTRLYRVKWDKKLTNTYIIDTIEGSEIACKPEIVGREFKELNSRASLEAAKIILELVNPSLPIIYLHILRASLGYQLHESLKSLGFAMLEAYVRPRYIVDSFRDHRERKVEIVYRDFGNIGGGDYILIVSDTIATGSSLVESLREAYTIFTSRDAKVEELVIYGFISIDSIKRIEDFSLRWGIKKIYVIAMQDITPLASNLYDMPLYGPDEELWRTEGKISFVGGIASYETLERMIPKYAPGMDQPGDWSERQLHLYNGLGYEEGNIRGHLEKSLEMLRSLYNLARSKEIYDSWVLEIYRERIKSIISTLTLPRI